jgi:hypothetical protein
MSINDFPMKPPKRPVEVTGIWLDAHSGRIFVRAEVGGKWRTIISEINGEGHISHIVEPSGILRSPVSDV